MQASAQNLSIRSLALTPIDTGALRQSQRIHENSVTRSSITSQVSYGVDYAAAVHEGTAKNFRVGQAKFLEQPLIQTSLAKEVANRIRRGLR